jgi:hypothetical protein
MKHTLLAAAAALALTMTAGPVYAVTFVGIGDTATIDFDGLVEGVSDGDLDADLVLTLSNIDGNDYVFTYALTNNSTGDDLDSRLTAFGFNVDPNFLTAAVSGDFTEWASGNVPGNLPNVEFCATSGDNNCNGGGGGGVVVGDTFDGTITLTFAVAPTQLELLNFYVRYQSLGADGEGSGVGVGNPCTPGGDCGGGGGGGNEVPEPSTWALMILGFGAAGGMLRRRAFATA